MTTQNPIPGIRACVFDAYGTLFDLASAAENCRDVLGDKVGQVAALWREKQLQYTWLRSLGGHYADFEQVTGDALDFTLETLGLAEPRLRSRLMDLYFTLGLFSEVPGVLRQLKDAGFALAILSNGTPKMLQSTLDKAGVTHLFDHVLSVDELKIYKTDARVYQLAVDRLGVKPGEISFQSSNGWDAYAASAFGLRVVWCNRYGQRPERLPGKPDREIATLAELPPLLLSGVRAE